MTHRIPESVHTQAVMQASGGRIHAFYKSYLGQWTRSHFSDMGVSYGCREQYMMYQKAILFGDKVTAEKIIQEVDPGKIQALGRQVEGFSPLYWDAVKQDIVFQGNLLDFTQNPRLWNYLDGTGNAILVEASKIDTIWGIGVSISNTERVSDISKWRGQNLLGKTLMLVRSTIRRINTGL